MLLILALFVIRPKVVKKPEPFVATIITPEELPQKAPFRVPPPKTPSRVPPVKEFSQVPRLPKNLPLPEKLSAIPTSRSAAAKSGPGGAARTPEASASPHSTVGPTRNQEEGTAQVLIKSGSSSQPGQGGPSARTMREKLFDRDIIAKLTPKTGEKPENDNGITFDTKEYKYYGYMQRLREKIEGIWKYPAEASERKLNGELYIRFTIKKDGGLGAVELVHTSGYKILDDAAIRALRDAEPYWPLPDSWNEDSLTITGHFVYYFHNTFIR